MPIVYIPFGDLRPDDRQFNNGGLQQAKNAVPVHGAYAIPPLWGIKSGTLPLAPRGLHVHASGESTVRVYYGDTTKLWDCDALNLIGSLFTIVDKTRLVGGAYNAAGAGGENGWQGTSFGDSIIMTDYVDDPQLLTSPSTANFVKLAQSGGGNPGMDPKAKFVFPIRGNLWLANLNLAAPFDGLPAGANPTTVCWSQSENIRQFGSFNVTPQLTGTDYQQLNYDFGHITGGIGGDYGLIAFQRGWVRADGPPYTFRPTVVGSGCRQPNSIVRYQGDVYYWGSGGLMVLRGGEGPPIALGQGRVIRTLIDNRTLFNFDYSVIGVPGPTEISTTIDPANHLVICQYTSNSRVISGGYTQTGDLSLVYNIVEDRFGFIENRGVDPLTTNSGVRFMKQSPDLGYGLMNLGTDWCPGRDTVGVLVYPLAGAAAYRLSVPDSLNTFNVTSLWEKCFQQFDKDASTRVVSVRPIFSRGIDTSTATVTVSVASKNRPSDVVTSTSFTGTDGHGRIVTPTTSFADFHRIQVSILSADRNSMMEGDGMEIEYAKGGRYSA